MSNQEQNISLQKATAEVRQACFHFSDLYFHFSKVLVDELGYDKAKGIIEKVVKNRAIERGRNLRRRAIEQKIPTNVVTLIEVTDIPFLGWDKNLGRLHCPYAVAWLTRYDENPWFKEIASLYCNVNDTQVTETYTEDTSHQITKNVLWGDDACERVYFPLNTDISDREK